MGSGLVLWTVGGGPCAPSDPGRYSQTRIPNRWCMGSQPISSKAGHANFVHLRVRSIYSLLEGAVRPKELAKLAREMRMPAVAVTDTNNLFGTYEISDALAKSGVQPIVGVTLSVDLEPGGTPQVH